MNDQWAPGVGVNFTYIDNSTKPVIRDVYPSSAILSGGIHVLIFGSDLAHNKSEIINITLAGVPVKTINFVSVNLINVTVGSASVPCSGDVVIHTIHGVAVLTNGFTYISTNDSKPVISHIYPNSGVCSGNETVTIMGRNLVTNSSDIINVTLAGVPVIAVLSANSTTITVLSGRTDTPHSGDVIVTSSSYGEIRYTNGFTYIIDYYSIITSVIPSTGPLSGDQTVCITGRLLCNGNLNDVVQVTLAGVPVKFIINATTTHVCVMSAMSLNVTSGPVMIRSISRGIIISSNDIQYHYESSARVPSISRVIPCAGRLGGGDEITIFGENLVSSSSEIDSVHLAGVLVKSIVSANITTVVVVSGASPSSRTGDVVISIINRGIAVLPNGFNYEVVNIPVISEFAPNQGPIAGGQTVTITGIDMCDGTSRDIISITIAGVSVSNINNVSRNVITITTGAAVSDINGTVAVTSFSRGRVSSEILYYYHAPGVISIIKPNVVPYDVHTQVTIYFTKPFYSGEMTDLIRVTLAGADAKPLYVGRESIIVEAQPVHTPCSGAIEIISNLYGTTVKYDAFSYIKPDNINDGQPGMSNWTVAALATGGVIGIAGLAGGVLFFMNRGNKKNKVDLLLQDVEESEQVNGMGDGGDNHSTTEYTALTLN